MWNVKAFPFPFSFPSVRDTLRCGACKEKNVFPSWTLLVNGASDLQGHPYLFMDNDSSTKVSQTPHLPEWNPIPQINYSAEIKRINNELESFKSKTKVDQENLRQLVQLLIERKEATILAKGRKKSNEQDRRIAQLDITIAELADVIGWKFQNK
jgi:hypothetical protein